MSAHAVPVHYASIEFLAALAHAPDELKGTTGYFRPEKARWTLSRGSRWARNEEEKVRGWNLHREGVEVFGPKTRAKQGGMSGVFFSGPDIPEWLSSQEPSMRDKAALFLVRADR